MRMRLGDEATTGLAWPWSAHFLVIQTSLRNICKCVSVCVSALWVSFLLISINSAITKKPAAGIPGLLIGFLRAGHPLLITPHFLPVVALSSSRYCYCVFRLAAWGHRPHTPNQTPARGCKKWPPVFDSTAPWLGGFLGTQVWRNLVLHSGMIFISDIII